MVVARCGKLSESLMICAVRRLIESRRLRASSFLGSSLIAVRASARALSKSPIRKNTMPRYTCNCESFGLSRMASL